MNWKPFDSLTTHSAFRRYCRPDHSSWYRRIAISRRCNNRKRNTDSDRWTHTSWRVSMVLRLRRWHLEPPSTQCGSPATNVFSGELINLSVKLTCAPIALSALVKLILANCPCVMNCQCSLSAFSPHISIGGRSVSGMSQRRSAAAAQPRAVINYSLVNIWARRTSSFSLTWRITFDAEQLEV